MKGLLLDRRNVLDNLDRKILLELDLNCRRSVSEIARKLKQSRERVEYRINRLVGEKIITHFEATLNPRCIGFRIYKTYIRLENERTMVSALVDHLKSHPRLSWLALCDGGWDICFCFYARSPEEFYDMHVALLSEFNAVILNFSSYCIIDIKMYKRGYLGSRRNAYVRVLGECQELKLDELDYNILDTIRTDARVATSDLSQRLQATPSVIQYRLKRLEEQGVITGYRIALDLSKMGLIFVKTQLYLRNYELALTEQFEDFCDHNPYISCFTRQIGDCNIEIEMHVPSYETYSDVMAEIRGRFSKLIRNFHTHLIRKSWYSWFPLIEDAE